MKSGQALIEILIAVGVSVVALLAIVQMSTQAVSNSGFATRRSAATAVASKVLEWIRGKKTELGWDGFKAAYQGMCSLECCFDPTVDDLQSVTCPADGEYLNTVSIRFVTPAPSGPEQINADVVVTWNEGSRVQESKQSMEFIRF